MLTEFEHLFKVAASLSKSGAIGLVDDEDIGDFQEPSLVRLHRVTPTRIGHHDRRVGRRGDVHLHLAHTNGLDDGESEVRRAEHAHGVGTASESPPRWPRVAIERMNTCSLVA